MSPADALLLFAASTVGSAMNAVAGGGSFIAFPMLLFTGVTPIAANATNTLALWCGTLASIRAYRSQLSFGGYRTMFLLSLAGGVTGAVLLLVTPEATFETLIPFLLLIATVLFAFGSRFVAFVRTHAGGVAEDPRVLGAISVVGQFLIAVYGGYFGAGIGILMLALLELLGMRDIHRMNALKTVLAGGINGIAVATFMVAGAIVWPQALVMIGGAVLGGYYGAKLGLKLPQRTVRRVILCVGVTLTAYFFWKTFG